MLLLPTTLWITINLAVIQMLITVIIADSSTEKNSIQSGILGNISSSQSNPDSTADLSPRSMMDNKNLVSLKNSHDEICNSNSSYNISHLKDSDIKVLIETQARDIDETSMNITKGFQKVENITSEFAIDPVLKKGKGAMKLAIFYLKSSEDLIESIKEHNSLIRAYKCRNKSQNNDVNEISLKEYEDKFNYNENVFLQFRGLYNLLKTYYGVYSQNEKYSNSMKQFNSSKNLDDLSTALTEMNITITMIEHFVNTQEEFHKFMGNNTIHQTYQTRTMLSLCNTAYWKQDLQTRKSEFEFYEKYVDESKFEDLLNKKIEPIVHGIIFALGFVGNFVLLIIFARHKEMRNPPSMMILNLTLADAFNLPINIPLFFIFQSSYSWEYGEGLCIAFRFLRQLGIAVSIYSIVVISIQRFLALTQMFKNNGWGPKLSTRFKSVLLILSVWVIGCLIATPHIIHAGIYDGQCYGAPKDSIWYGKFITLFDFILFCAIPLTIIATLSVATALVIRRSVKNIPGESMGMDKYIKTRIVSANVLIALTVVSAASYFPYYLVMLLNAWKGLQMEMQEYQVIFFIVYTLVFANCCFNPIALYIFSHKFRRYFQKYLFCRKIKDRKVGKKISSSGTVTSSSFMTKI